MSFAFGFRSDGDGGGSGGVSGWREWSFTGRREEWKKISREPGNCEGGSLGGNTLEDGAMGHGTPVTSVSPLGASFP